MRSGSVDAANFETKQKNRKISKIVGICVGRRMNKKYSFNFCCCWIKQKLECSGILTSCQSSHDQIVVHRDGFSQHWTSHWHNWRILLVIADRRFQALNAGAARTWWFWAFECLRTALLRCEWRRYFRNRFQHFRCGWLAAWHIAVGQTKTTSQHWQWLCFRTRLNIAIDDGVERCGQLGIVIDVLHIRQHHTIIFNRFHRIRRQAVERTKAAGCRCVWWHFWRGWSFDTLWRQWLYKIEQFATLPLLRCTVARIAGIVIVHGFEFAHAWRQHTDVAAWADRARSRTALWTVATVQWHIFGRHWSFHWWIWVLLIEVHHHWCNVKATLNAAGTRFGTTRSWRTSTRINGQRIVDQTIFFSKKIKQNKANTIRTFVIERILQLFFTSKIFFHSGKYRRKTRIAEK